MNGIHNLDAVDGSGSGSDSRSDVWIHGKRVAVCVPLTIVTQAAVTLKHSESVSRRGSGRGKV